MNTDHSLAIKLLNRQLKIYATELERMLPFREKEGIKEMEKRIVQLKTTVVDLEKISGTNFVNDTIVLEYLDKILKSEPAELTKLTKVSDDKAQAIIDLCIQHGAYGRAVRFANPEHFNKIRIIITEAI